MITFKLILWHSSLVNERGYLKTVLPITFISIFYFCCKNFGKVAVYFSNFVLRYLICEPAKDGKLQRM